MKQGYLQILLFTSVALKICLISKPTTAQIVPDGTLSVNSVVTPLSNTSLIEGGTVRGSNLFHSFKEFSIKSGNTAYFNNPLNITNILTRVTGGSISNINGVIKANGTANLFLINPNGIIFGKDGRLDIGGSFIGTSASSIKFSDGSEFSAKNPQSLPLLSINVPTGLQFNENPGNIKVEGSGYDLSVQVPIFAPITRGNNSSALRVSPGKSLALLGGNINLEGGILTAFEGRIDLGSVGKGEVSLIPTAQGFAFGYQNVQNFRDIRLSKQSLVDASGGGFIQVNGNNVSLNDGSLVLIQNQGNQQGGNINVNAAQLLEINDISPDGRLLGGLDSQTLGNGNAADITVTTKQLSIRNGPAVVSRSYGSAISGNVIVNANESVQLIGFAPNNSSFFSSIATAAFNSGNAGNVTVSTKYLTALDGGIVASTTLGTGNGGDVTINATESLEIAGETSIFTPSQISSIATNLGDSGKVIINTAKMRLRNGGSVSTATVAGGNAGSVTVNASEFIKVTGTTSLGSSLPSVLSSSASILPKTLQLAYGSPPIPTGNSGDVTINTPKLMVKNGALVSVSNQGIGKGGELQISANSILIDSDSSITAATASGEGGNIQLKVGDLLLLRRNSSISAASGGTGNGGNIEINTPFLVAVPKENSDISANSVNSRGGNIKITTQGIFGTQLSDISTPQSDITATGANSSLKGNVQINTPGIDPTSGLLELPNDFSDRSNLIVQGCPASKDNSFTITGKGGLPTNPQELMRSNETATIDWVTLPTQTEQAKKLTSNHIDQSTTPNQIIEANNWLVNKLGEVMLTASTANTLSQSGFISTPKPCLSHINGSNK